MANIRDLKKDINFVLGDIIEAVYAWEEQNKTTDAKNSEVIIDEAIVAFDGFIDRVNAKNVDNYKTHFKTIRQDLETTAIALIEKVNAL